MQRREFLRSASLAPLAIAAAGQAAPRPDVNLILLLLVGGPSQLDTWDPKPEAPADIRGPFRPIATKVPGVRFSELFPRMAMVADKFSLIRSVHHTAPAVHAAGHQLLQSGRFGGEHPHIGSVLSYFTRGRNVVIPGPIGDTGGELSHGQSAGWLGSSYEPEWHGATDFGRSCLLARQLIEAGVRCVTVSMFTTVYDDVTWDTHGWKPFTSLQQMAERVAPAFDQAYSTLLTELDERGLLKSTIVCAAGEFGRSPRFNHAGGRDHHPAVWTVLIGGGPIQGGRVVGASDRIAHDVKDRPVTPAEIVATLYRGLGIDPHMELLGRLLIDSGVEPIGELF
jgi:uncharacterized protein (DUF1501 family)